MGLFTKKKEKCCCDCNMDALKGGTEMINNQRIKVLGTGCVKCQTLEKNIIEALKELEIDETVGHVTDLAQIASYGVMSTPALVIDSQVVSYGRVLSKDEVQLILQKVRF